MWKYYNPNPTGRSEGIDCTVRAVSKALDTDWETAYVLIALNGFALGDVSCSDYVWGSVLKDHGFNRENLSKEEIRSHYTVGDFAEDNPEGTFVIGTGTHAVAIVDGNIYDSFNSSYEPVEYVWYRKDRK